MAPEPLKARAILMALDTVSSARSIDFFAIAEHLWTSHRRCNVLVLLSALSWRECSAAMFEGWASVVVISSTCGNKSEGLKGRLLNSSMMSCTASADMLVATFILVLSLPRTTKYCDGAGVRRTKPNPRSITMSLA